MNSLASWSRALMFALLCALICAPGALRARVCLVALGVIEVPSCRPEPSCCTAAPDVWPAVRAGGEDCHCCVDVVLDSNDKTPSVTPAQACEIVAPPLRLLCELTPSPLPPPGWERTRSMLVRERMRPAVAAVLPLRI